MNAEACGSLSPVTSESCELPAGHNGRCQKRVTDRICVEWLPGFAIEQRTTLGGSR